MHSVNNLCTFCYSLTYIYTHRYYDAPADMCTHTPTLAVTSVLGDSKSFRKCPLNFQRKIPEIRKKQIV